MPTLPYDPDWGRTGTIGKRVLSSSAVSGETRSRVKVGMKRSWELHFENRDATEFDAMVTFWDTNYPDTQFTYTDRSFATPRNVTVRFASDITDVVHSYNDRDYSFVIVEV